MLTLEEELAGSSFLGALGALGVVGVQRRRLIDFDEAGFMLEACDGRYGYGHYQQQLDFLAMKACEGQHLAGFTRS